MNKFSAKSRGLHLIKQIAGRTEYQEYDKETNSWIARNGQMGFIITEIEEGETVNCKFFVGREMLGEGTFNFGTGEKIKMLRRLSDEEFEYQSISKNLQKKIAYLEQINQAIDSFAEYFSLIQTSLDGMQLKNTNFISPKERKELAAISLIDRNAGICKGCFNNVERSALYCPHCGRDLQFMNW